MSDKQQDWQTVARAMARLRTLIEFAYRNDPPEVRRQLQKVEEAERALLRIKPADAEQGRLV